MSLNDNQQSIGCGPVVKSGINPLLRRTSVLILLAVHKYRREASHCLLDTEFLDGSC